MRKISKIIMSVVCLILVAAFITGILISSFG